MFNRKNLLTVFALLGVLTIASLGEAATYYVSPSGSNTNGNGSTANPWATLSYACSRVTTAGDTIYLNAGSYNDSVQCRLAPGVNIQGAGKATTTIYSSLNDWYILGSNSSVINGNQKISGFKIDGNNRTLAHGIYFVGRSNVTIENMDLVRIRATAIKMEGYNWWTNADSITTPPPGYAVGCVIRNVNITGCSELATESASLWLQSLKDGIFENINIDEGPGSTGTGRNAIKSYPGYLNHCIIRNSTFTVNPYLSMDAITMEMWNFENDSEIANCTLNEGYISLVSGRKNGGQWALKFYDNKMINTKSLGVAHELSLDDVDFYNNYITKEALGIWAATHGYNKDGLNNIRVHHNVIYNTNGQGITLQNGPGAVPFNDIQIYNNVIDSTDRSWPDAGISVSPNLNTTFSNVKITNNIFNNLTYGVYFFGNAGKVVSPSVTYNDFFNVTTQISNGGVVSPNFANNMSEDPQFAKTGSRPTYYKLLASSPLINRGANIGLPFNGAAPDLGAYEYTTISPPRNLRIQ